MNEYEWVFIPVIKGVTYEFKIGNDFVKMLKINGSELVPAIPLPTHFYFSIDSSRRITRFNNVFTLFHTIAYAYGNKIRMQVTFDPTNYIRGFIFPVQNNQHLDILDIFVKGVKKSVNIEAFSILNKNEILYQSSNIKNISVYVDFGNITDIIEEYAYDTISVVHNNTNTIIESSAMNIFKYHTPRKIYANNVIFIADQMIVERIKHETIRKWLSSGWNFYNKKIKVEPSTLMEIKNMLDNSKTDDSYDIGLLREFGFITDDSHVYYVFNTSIIVDIDELKKRFMKFLDTSIMKMKIPTDSEGMIENYETNIANYINKIEKYYGTERVRLVKVIHIDESNNTVELIDSILPDNYERQKRI